MDDKAIRELVKTTIEAQIVKALNEGPELVEKLVKAALSQPVDEKTGRNDGYSSNRISYIDYLVGNEIREAARMAVGKIVKAQEGRIEEQVRAALQDIDVVKAFAKAITGATMEEWRINVNFEREKR